MQTQYRRAGHRTFYRINGEHVLRIVNKESISQVDAGNNIFIRFDAKESNTVEITESEFKEQLDIAMKRINEGKI